MQLYTALLFLHIAGAVVWVGGASMIQLFSVRAALGGIERQLAFLDDVAWIGRVVLTPATLVVLGAGIGLVVDGPWSFGQDWVVIGLTLFAVAFVAGVGFFGPELERIARLGKAGAVEEARRRGARLTLVARIELGLLYLIVFDMSVKPQLLEGGAIAAGLAGLAAWSAMVVLTTRRAAPSASSGAPAAAAS